MTYSRAYLLHALQFMKIITKINDRENRMLKSINISVCYTYYVNFLS